MQRPEVIAKMRTSMQGRTFLARGGNGTLTEPQKRLAAVLGWPMEYVIPTRPAWGLFPSLPNHYKVDLADPAMKTAIEVDGMSHRSKKWRFLDARKTAVLAALGWSVLRFSNQRVMTEIEAVAQEIRASIASASTGRTASLPTAF